MASEPSDPIPATPERDLLDTIRSLGRILDDLEGDRVRTENRIRSLERERGEALPHLYVIIERVAGAEHIAELELARLWRRHPLAPWAKEQRGVGEKSIARLIAEIGDPAFGSLGHWETSTNGAKAVTESTEDAPLEDDESEARAETTSIAAAPRSRIWVIDSYYERTVSQLWAYCGVGDPARSRIPAGATQEELMKRGKPRAKKQLYLIGTGMIKAGIRRDKETSDVTDVLSEWGQIYLDGRERYDDRVHAGPCPPCHAKAGDPWKNGHKHMAALRLLEKAFLRDLWLEARRVQGLD